MSEDLTRIHNRLLKTIEANFSKPIKIDAIVESVNNSDHCFTIRAQNSDKIIECQTNEHEDLTKLNPGNNVIINGMLRLDPTNTGKVYFAVQYLYLVSEKDKFAHTFNMCNRFSDALNNDRFKTIIKKIEPKFPPTIIRNIGLITISTVPGDDQNIENFKTAFQEKCVGQLFIFRLKNENMSSHLQPAFEYFKKYHEIDLICLLTNKVTTNIICSLSSKDNIKYMLYRKSVPYVISVVSGIDDEPMMQQIQQMHPLTVLLSNKKIEGIDNCINFIHETQSFSRKQLDQGIRQGTNILEKMVENQRKKLFDLKIYMTKLSDYRFLPKINDSTISMPPEKLKKLLIAKLVQVKDMLHNTQIAISKHIIEDAHVQKMYRSMDELEKRTTRNNNTNSNINTNDDTACGSAPESTDLKNLASEHRSQSTDLKNQALLQNQYFQTYPNQINQAQKMIDDVVSEISNQPKKIENKTSDNNSNDTMCINIQRDNGNL